MGANTPLFILPISFIHSNTHHDVIYIRSLTRTSDITFIEIRTNMRENNVITLLIKAITPSATWIYRQDTHLHKTTRTPHDHYLVKTQEISWKSVLISVTVLTYMIPIINYVNIRNWLMQLILIVHNLLIWTQVLKLIVPLYFSFCEFLFNIFFLGSILFNILIMHIKWIYHVQNIIVT